MSNVSNAAGVGAPQFLSGAVADPSGASMSPESLLLYCSSRLDTLDKNIATYFAEAQENNRKSRELADVIGVGRWGGKQASGADILAHLDKAPQEFADKANALINLHATCTNPDAIEAAASEFKSLTGHDISEFDPPGGPRGTVSKEKVIEWAEGTDKKGTDSCIKAISDTDASSRIETLKDKLSGYSKSGELNMIQLQSLVSQRQLAIQLTTQLMQTAHETTKGVVGNIRS